MSLELNNWHEKNTFSSFNSGFSICQKSDAMATSKAFCANIKKGTRVQSHLMQNYAAPILRSRFGKHIASTFSDENEKCVK